MELKEKIIRRADEFVDVRNIEIATLTLGILIVWVNGKRFGYWDLEKEDFVSFFAF